MLRTDGQTDKTDMPPKLHRSWGHKRNNKGSIMGSCYTGDRNAEDHIDTDITCNVEERQQTYRLGTASYRLLGA